MLEPAIKPTYANPAQELLNLFTEAGVDSYFGTPCGVLSPLFAALPRGRLHTIAKEDNAVALAAGAACAGDYPAVLMQNSGLGQSLNVLASLVTPYRIPVLLVISLRGTEGDQTEENKGMGRLTSVALDTLQVPTCRYRGREDEGSVLSFLSQENNPNSNNPHCGPHAIMIHPHAFGWQA